MPGAILAMLFLVFLTGGCGGQAVSPGGTGTYKSTSTTLAILTSAGKDVVLNVEVAATGAERERGLMGRTALPDNAGMLFVFDRPQMLSFWMKDTLIPLSIAFIDSDGKIVDIQDMQPLDETVRVSRVPAKYALEVNQGFFGKHGIKVGDRVKLPDNVR